MTAPSFITVAELRAALNPSTFQAIFDEEGNGTVLDDNPAVQQVLERSYARVMAWLGRPYETLPQPLPASVPLLLKDAQLDYAQSFSYERHPEYVRSMGETSRNVTHYLRAEATMQKVSISVLQLSENKPEPKPRNVGGIVTTFGRNIISPGADGTNNGGDF